MNNGLKNFLIFAMGVGVGALATYQLLKDKYEAIAQEEIESVKQVFGRGETKEGDRDGDVVDEDYARPDMPNIEEKSRYKKIVKKYVPYNTVREGGPSGLVDSFKAAESSLIPCYVISMEAFSNDNPDYDKISISYYEDDDTLADEQDEIMQEVEGTIGEALLCFGDQSDDPDVVYVRNERLSIDYEVVRLHRSYQEAVLGIKTVDDRGTVIRAIRRRLNEDNG